MNCSYNFVFYSKNTMPLFFLPHLGGTLLLLTLTLPSPVKGEGNRGVHRGNALFSSSPISGEDRGGGGEKRVFLSYERFPPSHQQSYSVRFALQDHLDNISVLLLLAFSLQNAISFNVLRVCEVPKTFRWTKRTTNTLLSVIDSFRLPLPTNTLTESMVVSVNTTHQRE